MTTRKVIDYTHCADCRARGTYVVEATCSNCGTSTRVKLSRGNTTWSSVSGPECPACGCRRLRAGELITGGRE